MNQDPENVPTVFGPLETIAPANLSHVGWAVPDLADLRAQLPHLEILELLNCGGMGAVFKARQPELDRLVALKVLPAELFQDPAHAERFKREARALAALNHSAIVTLYDFGHTPAGLPFLLMEYVSGGDLRQALASTPREQLLAIFSTIADALHFAHERGIVHRDIKPENILLDDTGQPRLADFGLVRLDDRKSEVLTLAGTVMGTLEYMAPEQSRGEKDVDHRADIYSLGVMLYEALTGTRPRGAWAAPSHHTPLDVRMDELVVRSLQVNPAARPQSMSEFKRTLDEVRRDSTPGAPGAQFDWENLILLIEGGQVVPVIGHELYEIREDSIAWPFKEWLARRLAAEFKVSPDRLPAGYVLDDVIAAWLHERGQKPRLYPAIKSLIERTRAPVPEPLRQLAEITNFNFFLDTTFTPFLARALDEVRHGGAPRTRVLPEFGSTTRDLPPGFIPGDEPAVFHLLGRLSVAPDYVVTDEDMLEAICLLQSDARRPARLLDAVHDRHLLIIGCNFPDWLSRMFLRTARNERLSAQGASIQFLVDRAAVVDERLVRFLHNFSPQTDLSWHGTATEFVAQLHERWSARHAAESRAATSPEMELPPMPEDGIFLSYAEADTLAARKIRDSLDLIGIDVWMRPPGLPPERQPAAVLRRHVHSCAAFIPLISTATTGGGHPLTLEWSWAAERLKAGERCAFPLTLGLPDAATAALPPEFLSAGLTDFRGGQLTLDFAGQLRQMVRERRQRRRGLV